MSNDLFAKAMTEQFQRLVSGLWVPGKEEATTCASIPQLTQEQFKYEYLGRFDPPSCTPLADQKRISELMRDAADSLLRSMERELYHSMRSIRLPSSDVAQTATSGEIPSSDLSFGAMLQFDFIESEHCTKTIARWVRTRRSWQERLCGSALSLQQASLALAALLAASISFGLLPLCLFMALVIIRPHRWRVSQKPVKTWIQVPDSNVYLIRGQTLVGHPATIAIIKQAMAK
jgi:hypothetical protein